MHLKERAAPLPSGDWRGWRTGKAAAGSGNARPESRYPVAGGSFGRRARACQPFDGSARGFRCHVHQRSGDVAGSLLILADVNGLGVGRASLRRGDLDVGIGDLYRSHLCRSNLGHAVRRARHERSPARGRAGSRLRCRGHGCRRSSAHRRISSATGSGGSGGGCENRLITTPITTIKIQM